MMLLGKQSSNKEKYEQKDSLYIDVGQPLFNGRTVTLNASVNSNNNSMLLGNKGSNPNSLSKFAKGGKPQDVDLRKVAIMKNMQTADSDGESPKSDYRDRSNSVGGRSGFNMGNNKERSPDNIEDVSHENSQVQRNVDKIILGTPDKHPSKLLASGKRYSLLENRSAGNSPKGSPMKNGAIFSKFGEECKSPR